MTRWGDEPIAIDEELPDGQIKRSWYRSNHLIEVQILPPKKKPPEKPKPGRELDSLVAEKVMGFRWWRSSQTGRRAIFPDDKVQPWFKEVASGDESFCSDHDWAVPHYSTDIAAAWTVVKKLGDDGWSMNLEWKGSDRSYANTAEVSFSRSFVAHAVADTAPLAICLAAIRAIAKKS